MFKGVAVLAMAAAGLLLSGCVAHPGTPPVKAAAFRFDRDTFAFANETVFEYRDGVAYKRHEEEGKPLPSFTRRCFVMCRAADQFRKFARFEPKLPPQDDRALAATVRAVTGRAVWRRELPTERRIVVPGYADLRALSKQRALVLQKNIGLGWTTYVRPGNWRMFFYYANGPWHQAWTHEALEDALDRNDLFIGYLTTYPKLYINHAMMVYARKAAQNDGKQRYLAYDSNHPESPRELVYDPKERRFSYQKDWDFVGGNVTVLQVFGFPLQ